MKRCVWVLFVVAGLASPAMAQRSGVDGPVAQAISGTPSSGRHCISGNAANIHPIGWVASGTTYIVRINTDIELVTAVARLNLSGAGSATITNGSPEFNNTAASSGTMALYVAPRSGGAGCYAYQVSIVLSASAASVEDDAGRSPDTAGEAVRALDYSPAPLAISGTPSSAQFCTSGTAANVHEIGRVDQASRIVVSFDADFDAVAGISALILSGGAAADARYTTNDNSGGGTNPALSYSARAGDNLALFVGGVDGAVGCYRYKVEIQ